MVFVVLVRLGKALEIVVKSHPPAHTDTTSIVSPKSSLVVDDKRGRGYR
jgi:hypothetical protein